MNVDATFAPPFALGDVLWMPAHAPTQITVPCPVCAGHLFVTIILGDGDQLAVECDACGLGFEGARGVIQEWQYAPMAIRFEIAAVSSMHQGRWSVTSTTGGYAQYEELLQTEAAALAESERRCAAQLESNMQSRQRHRRNVKKLTWTAQYHRGCIADLQRQIDWHQSKLPQAAAVKGGR